MVFKLCCRTCLIENTELISLEDSINLDEFEFNITLMELVTLCASVQITLKDFKPQFICKSCIDKATLSYQFRKLCENSESIFSKKLGLVNQLDNTTNRNITCTANYLFSSEDDEPLSKSVVTKLGVETNSKSLKKHKKVYNKSNLEEQCLQTIPDSIHRCSECKETFTNYELLLTHSEMTHKEFKSEICHELTVKNIEMNRKQTHGEVNSHKMTNSVKNVIRIKKIIAKNRLKGHVCTECDQKFRKLTDFKIHLKAHVTFTCKLCPLTYTKHRSLQTHVNRLHSASSGDERLHSDGVVRIVTKCDICGKPFRTNLGMLKHKRLRHMIKTEELGAMCLYCEFTGTPGQLSKHMTAEHSHLKDVECTLCDKKFFTSVRLKYHMLTHTGEKPHVCEICGLGFALQGNLNTHRRVHTGERPYKCTHCPKSFTQHSALRGHEAIHSDRRDYMCSMCGAAFYRRDLLNSHLKLRHETVPEAERPRCALCEKTFTTRKGLKRHQLVHSGEKNHVCSVCQKGFGRRTSLTVHMRIHTGETPHVCAVCGKGFIQAHVLKTHMNTHAKKESGLSNS